MSSEPTAPKPVGSYCDHSTEPLGQRSHEGWEWTDSDGLVWQRQPDVITSRGAWEPDDDRRCPRAVPVYAVDVPALLAESERLESAIQGGLAHVGAEIERADKAEDERNNARTDVAHLRAVTSDLQNLVEELRSDGLRVHKERAEAKAEAERLRAELVEECASVQQLRGHLQTSLDEKNAARAKVMNLRGERDRLAEQLRLTPTQMVAEFHSDLLDEGPQPLRLLPEAHAWFRQQLLLEETQELAEAIKNGDLTAIADGLADIVYVAFGTAHSYGIPLTEVLAEVHRSNMTKTAVGDGTDRKPVKGPGYSPPQIAALLAVPTPSAPSPTGSRAPGRIRSLFARLRAGQPYEPDPDDLDDEYDEDSDLDEQERAPGQFDGGAS